MEALRTDNDTNHNEFFTDSDFGIGNTNKSHKSRMVCGVHGNFAWNIALA